MLTYLDRILIFDKIIAKLGKEMTPHDIALYHALLHVWNRDRSSDEITISRDEILKYSLLAKNTFYTSLNNLNRLRVIKYTPGKGIYGKAEVKFLNSNYVQID